MVNCSTWNIQLKLSPASIIMVVYLDCSTWNILCIGKSATTLTVSLLESAGSGYRSLNCTVFPPKNCFCTSFGRCPLLPPGLVFLSGFSASESSYCSRQSEGRRGEDYNRHQSGGLPRIAGYTNLTGRLRSPVQRLQWCRPWPRS